MTQQHTIWTAPLARLERASVTRAGAHLLQGVSFRLDAGARWAVLGKNGAGKTTFLRLLRGDIAPDEGGGRVYDLPGQGGPQRTPLGLRQRLALVSGDMQDQYARNEWAITGLEAVLTGFHDTALLYAEPTAQQRAQAQATLDSLGLSHLAEVRVARMSTGQARTILLARALACQPDALLLDECLEGLDAAARREVLAALDRAAKAAPGLALLFCTHRTDELPACLTLALVLEAGRIRACGTLAEMLAHVGPADLMDFADLTDQTDPAAPETTVQEAAALAPMPLDLAPAAGRPDFLVRVRNADVVMDGQNLLHNVTWTIRPGEHWAVLGQNGAGKSTLLALLAGDFWPSALEGEPGRVEYGFAPPGETLDETRRRIGRVSAALDRDYSWDLRVQEAVWSGALGSIGLHAEVDEKARARAQRLLEFFGLAGLAARRIRSLSRGQLRRVMLARALVGCDCFAPALLLLDEPMAGLDTRARRATRTLLERLAEAGSPLVMVTHHLRDLPRQMNRVLHLEAGRVLFCGPRTEYALWQADAKKQAAHTKRTA